MLNLPIQHCARVDRKADGGNKKITLVSTDLENVAQIHTSPDEFPPTERAKELASHAPSEYAAVRVQLYRKLHLV